MAIYTSKFTQQEIDDGIDKANDALPSTGGTITASIVRVCGITAYASLICDIDKGKHLRVVPTEMQWVDVGLYQDYHIETNREWVIE